MIWSTGIRLIPFRRKNSFTPLENFNKIKGTSLTGFTLIELLVVIVIIGTLLTFSLPHFRNTFNNLKFDNFCQNLISRMRYLQERASVEQRSYRLNFDLNSRIIRVEVKEAEEFIDVKGLLGKQIIIPEGVGIEVEETDIFFYPDGSIGGEDIEISDYQNQATISIRESIGRIELEQNEE